MKTSAKNKKFIWIMLGFVFILALGLAIMKPPVVVCYAETTTETTEEVVTEEPDAKSEISIYFEEKIMPTLISVCAAIATILTAILPVLSIVKRAANKFTKASSDVENTISENKSLKKRVSELEKKIDTIEKHTANTEEIARIGFGNIDELVVKGYANEIAKVGQNEESEE